MMEAKIKKNDSGMLTPEQRLEIFKGVVSWADDLSICYFGKVPYCQTENLVLFPCHWSEVTALTSYLQLPLGKMFIGCEIGLIIDGDCPHSSHDGINSFLGTVGLIPFWLQAKQRIRWSSWLLRLTDGANIFDEVANGIQN